MEVVEPSEQPNDNMPKKRVGTIQASFSCADQPKPMRPIRVVMVMGIAMTNLNSGLVQATVASCHGSNDKVTHLTSYASAQDATDERGDVDEAGLQRRKVVRGGVAVDDGHCLRDDDQPADGAGIHGSRPQNCRVGEQNEGPDHDFDPSVVVEAAVEWL